MNITEDPDSTIFNKTIALYARYLQKVKNHMTIWSSYSHIHEVQGESAFGSSFIDRLNQVLSPLRQANYRHIPYLSIHPSRDLGQIAASYIRDHRIQTKNPLMEKIIRILARLESRDEADLCSYLLFDGQYCERLINLGMDDAHANREKILRFFDA